jgi:hypothetical protein
MFRFSFRSGMTPLVGRSTFAGRAAHSRLQLQEESVIPVVLAALEAFQEKKIFPNVTHRVGCGSSHSRPRTTEFKRCRNREL